VVPVLVQLGGVEVGGELRFIGRIRRREVINRRSLTVRR
jgi:hypothetical protein